MSQEKDDLKFDPETQPIKNWKDMSKEKMMMSGYVKANNELIRYIIHESDAQTAMLYVILFSHRNTRTNLCFPTLDTLGREMHLSVRTISRMIQTLKDLDVISVDSGTKGRANSYHFRGEYKVAFKQDLTKRWRDDQERYYEKKYMDH